MSLEHAVQTVKQILKNSDDPHLVLCHIEQFQCHGVDEVPIWVKTSIFFGEKLCTTIPQVQDILRNFDGKLTKSSDHVRIETLRDGDEHADGQNQRTVLMHQFCTQ